MGDTIAIARALSVEPTLIIADEITSAPDLTTQAENLNLLADLMVESGAEQDIFDHPSHEYTQKLMASVPGGPGFTLSPTAD